MEKVIDILLDCQIVVGVELIVSVVFVYLLNLHLVPDATMIMFPVPPSRGWGGYDILQKYDLFYI